MIPNMTKGQNFRGAYLYFCHDKKARTRDRIDWTHTENMLTDNVDLAWKVMAYTALESERLKEASGQKRTGQKLKKPVIAYSLAWHPEQNPDKDEMLTLAQQSIKALGLEEHEAIIVAHRDEPQKHVHVVVNSVHPITGLVADQSNSWRKLSSFAGRYERSKGKIYCSKREANYQHNLKQKGKLMRHEFNISEAWKNSDNGQSFKTALSERGYQLARGRKGVVIVDPEGAPHRPARRITDVKTRDIQNRMADLDIEKLPDADDVILQIKSGEKSDKVMDSATKAVPEQDNGPKKPIVPKATPGQLNRLQDEHFDECHKVSSRHHRRIEIERDRLMEYYDLEAKKQEIMLLRERARNPGWWRRLTGLAKRDRQDFKNRALSYKDARSRLNERIDFLKKDRDQALDSLKSRQVQEMKLLDEHGPEVLEAHRLQRFGVNTEEPRVQRSRGPSM